MTPILFAENSTTFTTNGIGRLSDALACIVTEERNGQYELAMEYPISGQHYEDIGIRKIIVVKPSAGGDLQPFRIYKITKPIAGRVGIYAQHISYDLSKNVVMPFSVEASANACAETLAGLKTNAVEPCPFTLSTDVTRISSYHQTAPMSFRSRLGGSEGSVLDQFHGEYEFDVYDITLHSKRGHDNGVVLRYGKNITDLEQEENISETITGVVPYWSNMDGTRTVTLPEKAIYSQYASRYSQKLTVPLDLSEEYDEEPSVATIRAAAQSYIAQYNLGVPEVSISVSFINLRDTAEYADIADLETVNLCDDVHVQFEPLGIDTIAEVVKCVWNVLADRYNEISIGSLKSSLTSTLNKQNSQNVAAIEKTRVQAGNAINQATAWLSSGDGYIVAIKGNDGEWKELLAMDTPDTATATKVMRLNENGLGGSSSGIGGPYLSAILSDGTIVADRMKTGVLSDLNNKFSLNMQTGQLSMAGGTFSGTITGSTIKFGDAPNYAQMYWKEMHDQSGTWYELALEAVNGEPIYIVSQRNSSIYSHLLLNPGELTLYSTNTAAIRGMGSATLYGKNAVNILAQTANKVKINDWYAGLSVTSDMVLGTFEQNGFKYLGVYTDNHDGSAAPWGYVQLTSS